MGLITVNDECSMCAFNAWDVSDLPPRERAFSNEHWRALVHRSALPGWLVVGLRRHVLSLDQLTPDEALSLGPVLVGGTEALVASHAWTTYGTIFAARPYSGTRSGPSL